MSGGWVIVWGSCYVCKTMFGFNPHRVPSFPVSIATGEPDPRGHRMPICRLCATRANEARKAAGLPIWDVSDEVYAPIEEGEL